MNPSPNLHLPPPPFPSKAAGVARATAPTAPSLAGAWTALTSARDAIADDIRNEKLGGIHAKSEQLPELVKALLAHSGDLDAARRVRVDGAAKQLVLVAGPLHTAAAGAAPAKSKRRWD